MEESMMVLGVVLEGLVGGMGRNGRKAKKRAPKSVAKTAGRYLKAIERKPEDLLEQIEVEDVRKGLKFVRALAKRLVRDGC
jgi:hypothetical protein